MLRIPKFLLVVAALVSAHPASAHAEGLRWPVDGAVVTEFRTGSNPYAAGQHRGIDIAAALGAVVVAPAEGEVTYSGRLPDGGESVTISSGGRLLSHLHLATRIVKRGDKVDAGSPLGTVGTTGKRSIEQPHLHFGVRDADTRKYVDPMTLLSPREAIAPAPVAPAPVSVPIEKRTEKRASRSAPARRREPRTVRTKPVARPVEQPAAAKSVSAESDVRPKKSRDPVDLRAPSPMPAVRSVLDDPKTVVVSEAPKVEPAQTAKAFDPRLPLLALAGLLIAGLAWRGRRQQLRPVAPEPAAPREEPESSNVVDFTRAS
jgi:hypothetical protein